MQLIEAVSWDFPKIKWLDHFMTGHSGFIAGGCFKQIFKSEKVKDIDIFFENEIEFEKAVIYFRDSDSFTKYYTSKKVEAFKCKKTGITLELIRSTFGSPQEVIGDFDFTITKFAYYKHTEPADGILEESVEYKCLYSPKYFEHLMQNRLVVDDKTPFPISTFDRMFRYAKYGYYPCRDTKAKVIAALRELEHMPDSAFSLYDGVD